MLQCGDPTGSGMGGPEFDYDEENLPSPIGSDHVYVESSPTWLPKRPEITYRQTLVGIANEPWRPGTSGSQFFFVSPPAPMTEARTVRRASA